MYNISVMYRRKTRARRCTNGKRAKSPTCFAVLTTQPGENERYLRLRAVSRSDGAIDYVPTEVKSLADASKFTQTKTMKERLAKLVEVYGLSNPRAISL